MISPRWQSLRVSKKRRPQTSKTQTSKRKRKDEQRLFFFVCTMSLRFRGLRSRGLWSAFSRSAFSRHPNLSIRTTALSQEKKEKTCVRDCSWCLPTVSLLTHYKNESLHLIFAIYLSIINVRGKNIDFLEQH